MVFRPFADLDNPGSGFSKFARKQRLNAELRRLVGVLHTERESFRRAGRNRQSHPHFV